MDIKPLISAEVAKLILPGGSTLRELPNQLDRIVGYFNNTFPGYGLSNIRRDIDQELARRGLPSLDGPQIMPWNPMSNFPTFQTLPIQATMPIVGQMPISYQPMPNFPGFQTLPTQTEVSSQMPLPVYKPPPSKRKLFVTDKDYLVIWEGNTVQIWVGNYEENGQNAADAQGNAYVTDVYNTHPSKVATYENVVNVIGFEYIPSESYPHYNDGVVFIKLGDGRYVLVHRDIDEITTESPIVEFFQVPQHTETVAYAITDDELYYFDEWRRMPLSYFTEEEIRADGSNDGPSVNLKYYSVIDSRDSTDYPTNEISHVTVYYGNH